MKSLYEEKYDLVDNAIKASDFRNIFLEQALVLAADVLEIDLSRPTYKKALTEYLLTLLTRKKPSDVSTGVVFAGYGKAQFFLQLLSYVVDGKHGDSLRLWLSGSHNINLREEREAVVFPFAQTDMTDLFMSGIADSHADFMKSFFKEVLKNRSDEVIESYVGPHEEKIVEKAIQDGQNEKILSIFNDRFKEFVSKKSVDPVLRAVELLPREDMAAMAEALVELTTLKRKVASVIETVGGPTDVAVISKGEGLVWIKRKHYFASEINSDYKIRKSLRLGHSNEETA